MKQRLILVVLLMLILQSCAPGANEQVHIANAEGQLAGFWLGVWHGIIAPFTFVISLFSDKVGLYEAHNNGGWYNFGFVIGLSVIFGSSGRRAPTPKLRWRRG